MERINGILFKQMLESGMNNLSNHSAEIDALNVFPVPDGDTGTNMHLTVSNGVKEALKTNSDSKRYFENVISWIINGRTWELWCYYVSDF